MKIVISAVAKKPYKCWGCGTTVRGKHKASCNQALPAFKEKAGGLDHGFGKDRASPVDKKLTKGCGTGSHSFSRRSKPSGHMSPSAAKKWIPYECSKCGMKSRSGDD